MAELICARCNEKLVMKKADFEYVGCNFSHTLPVCPKCGQVFLSEEFVKDRVVPLEEELEEK